MNPDAETVMGEDILVMSDEEFLGLDPSRYDGLDDPKKAEKEEKQEDGEQEPEQDEQQEDEAQDEDDGGGELEESEPEKVEPPRKDPGLAKDDAEEEVVEAKADAPSEAVDYKKLYGQIMAPFKANGRTIEIKTPEEAISLMQKGANYAKTMQRLKPYKRVLTMLEKHELLDEDKLSYLIDLEKKNEGAIRKLVKESGIDPMDIGDADNPTYEPGYYQVSDEETSFREALDQLNDTDGGSETIAIINRTWDAESKGMIWKHPGVQEIIHTHRLNGVYDKIADEVERLRTLGQIPETTSFLQAYQELGNQMFPANGNGNPAHKTGDAPRSRVVDKGIAPSQQKRVSSDPDVDRRLKGTSSSKSSRGTREEFKNPLEMSDDDFLKQMEGRL